MEKDWRCGSRVFLAGALLLCLLFGCLNGSVQGSPVARHAHGYSDESALKTSSEALDIPELADVEGVPAFASLEMIKRIEESVQSSLQDIELSRKKHRTALKDEELEALSHVKCNVTTIEIPDNAGAKDMLDSGKSIKRSKKHPKDEAMRIYNGQIVTDKNMFPQIVALMHMEAMVACVSVVDTKLDAGNCGVVTKAEIAPGYTDSVLGLNDIMILVLDRNVITDGVKRMKVSFSEVAHGAATINVGFGYNTPGLHQIDGKLRWMDSRAVRGDQCRLLAERDAQVKADMVCSDGNYDGSRAVICSGDSGGPLILNGDVPENHVQIGVASFVNKFGNGDCSPDYESAYVNTWTGSSRAFLETEVAANGGSLLVADAGNHSGGNGNHAGTCQDQVNACVSGVNLQCGQVALTAECCGQLKPGLQCVLGVANVCGDVGLAQMMQESLAILDRDCPAEGAVDCNAMAQACSQLGALDCLASPLTATCCNTVSPVIDCYFPLTNGCLTPESADYVKNVKGYLDWSCPSSHYY